MEWSWGDEGPECGEGFIRGGGALDGVGQEADLWLTGW